MVKILKLIFPDIFPVLLVLSVLLASLFPVSGVQAQEFHFLTNAAISLLFFLHGAKLARSTVIAGFTNWKLQSVTLMMTYLIFPILGLLIGFLSPGLLSREIYMGFLFLCILPSTVQSSIAFTAIAKGNVPAAVCAATLSNLLGIFITPFLADFLMNGQGHGASFETIKTITLQLLLPFILGQIVQPYSQLFLNKHKKIVRCVDMGSILLVVYTSFSDSVTSGLWREQAPVDLLIIAIIAGILLAIVLGMTIHGSRFLGFSKEDEITITFCGSKKTLASGVPMAMVLFSGQNIGALLLPLMIFHQIQLMVCAVIAQHYGKRE